MASSAGNNEIFFYKIPNKDYCNIVLSSQKVDIEGFILTLRLGLGPTLILRDTQEARARARGRTRARGRVRGPGLRPGLGVGPGVGPGLGLGLGVGLGLGLGSGGQG